MRNRRKARELAMQVLFYMDMSHNYSEEAVKLFCGNFVTSKSSLSFFLELINGVIKALPEIDSVIRRFSSNWKISRMSIVDRNIMRLAVYEMLFCGDIPSKVSINEAIDIGKKFGTEESGAFINGILDSIRISLEEEKIIKPQTLTNTPE
ncbi:MAG: transcription antitermination factor NusB [Proteobacteria bacterium]|nr:transcription antitermination factor NusB [Desulfobacteraceae bacterium]MBU3981643.1 transcription antitermination factor NusB [Pseudomonadota bacterium]MBU4012241.1 transcription antitermination factor NusB [Pseudomonadota bacterium]MBU4068581.1 transcription antitermination factor NusB [Pseudomonadota bacterium]MBU4099763.1 transcription antitermination factor NusB [Pseudomonadota bacterium]